MGARCTCKWEQLWYDDAVLGLGYIVAAGHFGTIFHSISSGMGASALYGESSHMGMVAEVRRVVILNKHKTGQTDESMSVLLRVQDPCLRDLVSKQGVGLAFHTKHLYLRCFEEAEILRGCVCICWHLRRCKCPFELCCMQSSTSSGEPGVCRLRRECTLTVLHTCSSADIADQIARWGVITALDIATELVIVALPAFAISGVQVMTSKKRLIVFVFSFRLALIVFSIMVMVKYFDFLRGSRSEVDLVQTVAWQEIQIGFSLISASIPCIRTFLWAFMSMGLTTTYGSHYSASGSRGGSQQLQSMQRSDAPLHPSEVNNDRSLRANASRFLDYKVDVKAMQRRAGRTPTKQQDGESGSVNSNSSEQMIIQRKREVEVHFT